MFLAPNINSYKRYAAGSWAPTTLAWGYDNRTCGFRVVGHGNALRVECRIPGADANPYLAFAALLAAGLHGIEQQLEPPPAFTGNAYESDVRALPAHAATRRSRALEHGTVARAAFGDDVVDHYLNYARTEQQLFDQRGHLLRARALLRTRMTLRLLNPATEQPARRARDGGCRGDRPRGRGGEGRVPSVARGRADRPRPSAAPARGARRGASRGARAARDAERRQADRGLARRGGHGRRGLPLLRRCGRQALRADDPGRRRRRHDLPRAARRRRA